MASIYDVYYKEVKLTIRKLREVLRIMSEFPQIKNLFVTPNLFSLVVILIARLLSGKMKSKPCNRKVMKNIQFLEEMRKVC